MLMPPVLSTKTSKKTEKFHIFLHRPANIASASLNVFNFRRQELSALERELADSFLFRTLLCIPVRRVRQETGPLSLPSFLSQPQPPFLSAYLLIYPLPSYLPTNQFSALKYTYIHRDIRTDRHEREYRGHPFQGFRNYIFNLSSRIGPKNKHNAELQRADPVAKVTG